MPSAIDDSPRYADKVGILVWGEVFSSFATFIAPIVVVRLLGVAQVGAFATLMLVYDLVVAICASGLPRVAVYFMANRDDAERYAIARQLMAWIGGAAAIAGLLLLLLHVIFSGHTFNVASLGQIAAAQDTHTIVSYLPGLSLYALADLPCRLTPNIFLAEGRPKITATLEGLRSLGVVLSALIPAALGANVFGILLTMIAFGWALAGLHAGLWWHVFRNRPRIASPLRRREISLATWPMAANQIVGKLLSATDLWLIFYFFGQQSVGIYAQGAWLIPFLSAILWSVGPVYLPPLKAYFNAGQARDGLDMIHPVVERCATLIVPISLILVINSEDFVEVAYGQDFAGAAWVLRFYALRHWIRVANASSILLAAGGAAAILRISLWTLLANLVLSIPLIFGLGMSGAALGTFLADLVEYGLSAWIIASTLGVPLKAVFPLRRVSKVWALGLAAALPALFGKWVFDGPAGFGLTLTVVLVLTSYVALAWSTKVIGDADFRYLARWLTIRGLR